MLRVLRHRLRPLLAVAALAAAACASEESQWQAAESAATVDAYQEFLGAYPESAHRSAAEARIAFLQAEADNTIEAYRQYLADYPDGRDGAVAEERLAALEVGSEIGWCANPEDADREFEVFVARRDTTLSFDDLRSTFRWDESVGLL
ncbi:MAG: tetratricopeptide repeat protein, partial [Planctomycetota bacterium]